MPESFFSSSCDISRRNLLKAAAVGGVVLGAGLASTPAEAKMGQKAAAYRPTPNGKQRCDNCALFQPPSACKLVDGTIAPAGWCNLYRAK